jgi:hypothetical protein
MAGKRLTELPTISEVTGAELVYVVDQVGVSRQSNLSALLDLLDDIVQTDALQKDENLSDLPNPALARTNLGLGSISTQDADSVDITGGTLDGVDIGAVVPSNGTFEDVTITDNLILVPGATLTLPPGSISSSALTEDSINIIYADGLAGDGTVALGGTLNISLPEVDGGDF